MLTRARYLGNNATVYFIIIDRDVFPRHKMFFVSNHMRCHVELIERKEFISVGYSQTTHEEIY